MPEALPSSTPLLRISPAMARIALLALVIAMLALVAVSLGMTEPVRRAGPSDLDTYERVVGALRAGQAYYPALHEALLAGDYGTLSPLNWRMPLFLMLLSWFPSLVAAQVFLSLLTVVAWLIGIAWGYRTGGTARAIGVGVALALSLIAIVVYRAELSFELFAGTLILVSFAAYGLGWRWLGVAAAALALFTRELSLLYVLVCLGLAVAERRRGETFAWIGILVAFAAFYAWHASQAMALIGPADHAARADWLQFGGLDFVLRTASFNGVLLVLPYWVGAVVLVLGLVGLTVAWRGLATVVLFLLLFLFYGRPENSYWGALFAPLLAIGVAQAVPVLKQLIDVARLPRSS